MNNSILWVTQGSSQIQVQKNFPHFLGLASLFYSFLLDETIFLQSQKIFIYQSYYNVLKLIEQQNLTSVTQEKIKSVGFPVAIQTLRALSKSLKKEDDQAQLGHTKGNIFICGRAI